MTFDVRSLKKEKDRAKITLGGVVLDYLGETLSPEASLVGSNLLFNRVISDRHLGAWFDFFNLKNFPLINP